MTEVIIRYTFEATAKVLNQFLLPRGNKKIGVIQEMHIHISIDFIRYKYV